MFEAVEYIHKCYQVGSCTSWRKPTYSSPGSSWSKVKTWNIVKYSSINNNIQHVNYVFMIKLLLIYMIIFIFIEYLDFKMSFKNIEFILKIQYEFYII